MWFFLFLRKGNALNSHGWNYAEGYGHEIMMVCIGHINVCYLSRRGLQVAVTARTSAAVWLSALYRSSVKETSVLALYPVRSRNYDGLHRSHKCVLPFPPGSTSCCNRKNERRRVTERVVPILREGNIGPRAVSGTVTELWWSASVT